MTQSPTPHLCIDLPLYNDVPYRAQAGESRRANRRVA